MLFTSLILKVNLFFLLFIFFVMSCSEEKDVVVNSDMFSASEWSQRMAMSEISRLGNSLQYYPENSNVKWNYESGLLLKSFLEVWQHTKDPKYLDYVKKIMDSFIESDGTINTYKMSDYNIDNINPGKVLLWLYRLSHEDKYLKASTILREQLQNHPRTKEGGFWHKKRYPFQMWLDGIYMGCPFYAEYSILLDDSEGLEDVVRQILLIDVHIRDSKTGLRYHGWDESYQQRWADPETGCSPNFWGRAMGWYAMALVDVLDFLPHNQENRQKIVFILDDLLKSFAGFQDEESGLWYQVVDKGEQEGNYLEASVSAMMAYSYAKAINNGYLDKKYTNVAEKAYRGLLNNLVQIDNNGQVNIKQICSVAGLGGDPYRDGSYDYYIGEAKEVNDPKGVGPFIMAGLQIEELRKAK